MYSAQHDWASINTLLWHSDLRRYKSELTHSGTGRWKQKVAEGEGGQGATGNWMMMDRWTRACTCKDLPVWTPEWRQCVHGHGFRQGTDAVPAPWGQAEPASSAQRRKIWKYVPSLSSLLVWFSPGRELLGYFTVYLSSLSFVVCFAGLLWPLVVHRHTQTRPWPEGDVNKLIWLICWFWKNFNSFD